MAPTQSRRVVVAIPARDEAERIPTCLRALACQHGAAADAVVVVFNNCADDGAAIARALAPALPFALHALEVTLPPEAAFAGTARRLAMERAAELAGPDGVLLGTDADGEVAPDWIAANLAALRAGADAVAGRAEIDPAEARLIPAHLHAADALECAYAALLDEIDALSDPDPADPWPRHDEHSGASIAVTAAAHTRVGGIPAIRLAEDRAFFAALRRSDARIRHAPEVHVTVSGRVVGRAPGGMADTIRRRMQVMDDHLDDRLEPAADAARRSALRARLRSLRATGHVGPLALRDVAHALRLSPVALASWLSGPLFGDAWAEVEAHSPALARRRVPVAALAAETRAAERLRDALRGGDRAAATQRHAAPVPRATVAEPVGRGIADAVLAAISAPKAAEA